MFLFLYLPSYSKHAEQSLLPIQSALQIHSQVSEKNTNKNGIRIFFFAVEIFSFSVPLLNRLTQFLLASMKPVIETQRGEFVQKE